MGLFPGAEYGVLLMFIKIPSGVSRRLLTRFLGVPGHITTWYCKVIVHLFLLEDQTVDGWQAWSHNLIGFPWWACLIKFHVDPKYTVLVIVHAAMYFFNYSAMVAGMYFFIYLNEFSTSLFWSLTDGMNGWEVKFLGHINIDETRWLR